MNADLGVLDDHLDEHACDAYCIHATGSDPNQRYLAGFPSADPYTSLYVEGSVHLLVRGLDRNLARSESHADTVVGPETFDRSDLLEEYGSDEADRRVLRRFLGAHDVDNVAVPGGFPVRLADALRDGSITVVPDDRDVVETARAVKTEEEIEAMRTVQDATERGMAAAQAMLAEATAIDGVLHHEEAPLTSERVREEIAVNLLREGCHARRTIVAGGPAAADPHERGRGPLPADAPIVVDIFPGHGETQYHADMTRTFCVGEPSPEADRFYEITEQALDAALDVIEAGVTGAEVHETVCAVYEEFDVPTVRSDPGTERGFVHGTGHGVGLAVHEEPHVNGEGGTLRPGHVISVEPGCYDPDVGGVRIEDLVVVTEDGYDNLTSYDYAFRV